jgi:hypothetical protein
MARVRVGHGIAGQKYCVIGGCLLSKNLVILHLPAYEDGTECSETSAYKIQTPENYPEENIQHAEHGESLK